VSVQNQHSLKALLQGGQPGDSFQSTSTHLKRTGSVSSEESDDCANGSPKKRRRTDDIGRYPSVEVDVQTLRRRPAPVPTVVPQNEETRAPPRSQHDMPREVKTVTPSQDSLPSLLQATHTATTTQPRIYQLPYPAVSVGLRSSLDSTESARASPTYRGLAPSHLTRPVAGERAPQVTPAEYKSTASTNAAAVPLRNKHSVTAVLPQPKHLFKEKSPGILSPTKAQASASAPPSLYKQNSSTNSTPCFPLKHSSAPAQSINEKDKSDGLPATSYPYHHHKLPHLRPTSPEASDSAFHHHRLPETVCPSGTHNDAASIAPPNWDGGRRHSLSTPSWPLSAVSSFDHIPLPAPLARRHSEVPEPHRSATGRQPDRPTLPPWSTLVTTRERSRKVKEPGPKLPPIKTTPAAPPDQTATIDEDEEEVDGQQYDDPLSVLNRPVALAPPKVTIPLRPEETAGRWGRVEEISRPGSETFELWPPPAPASYVSSPRSTRRFSD
jgi:hypothetical protein